jgi:hypothetical protein
MSPDQLISGWASTTTQEATTESCSSKAASVWGTKNTNVDEQGSENHVLLNQAKESSDWNKKAIQIRQTQHVVQRLHPLGGQKIQMLINVGVARWI